MTGVDESEVDLAEYKSSLPENFKVGMMHSRFALFFMNVWTWGGEIVLYTDDTYYTIDIPQDQAIAKYGKPFSYSYPTFALLTALGLGGYVAFILMAARQGSRKPVQVSRSFTPAPEDMSENSVPKTSVPRPSVSFKKEFTDEELQEMYEDPRYQNALQINDSQGLEAALDSLVETGMQKTQARYSFKALIQAVEEAQQAQAEEEEIQPASV